MSADVPGGQNLPDAELLSYEISKADKWAEEIAKQAEWVRSREREGWFGSRAVAWGEGGWDRQGNGLF